ncbi:MAG: DUF2252 family protein [Rhodococcus sp. (in: high G+C Gram-positive bacteria)]
MTESKKAANGKKKTSSRARANDDGKGRSAEAAPESRKSDSPRKPTGPKSGAGKKSATKKSAPEKSTSKKPATKKSGPKKSGPKKSGPKKSTSSDKSTKNTSATKPSPSEMTEPSTDRSSGFRELAMDRANGKLVMLPRFLAGNDRRLHVRQTLREDHEIRIARGADDAHLKFDKLDGSLFSFFRGTCLLFYRDMAGEDAWMPTVLTLGDVHPENFGVMPSADNVPIFGVNDFDEAYYAPFTWDLKRGAVGFTIGAQVEGGLGRKRQRRVVESFVHGYIDAIEKFAEDGNELEHQMRMDNAPKLIRKLIEDADDDDRDEWLVDRYHDEFRRGFRASDELVPLSSRRAEFQKHIDRFVKENEVPVPDRAGRMHVKDVCIRLGQGTASLGLSRYYVLIEGARGDSTDDLIIEFKQARRSALSNLVPPSEYELDGHGERIAHAQGVQLVRGDVFYGGIEFEGTSFMVRERAPFRDDIDLDDLSKKEWNKYAKICGGSLGHAHSLSDETGLLDHDIEPILLEAIGDRDLFVDDIVRFASEAADRVRSDHEHFRKDYALGAFSLTDKRYR